MSERVHERHELSWRNLSLAEGALLAALVLALVVQYGRGAWPFAARHVATPIARAAPTEAPTGHATSGPAGPHAAHAVPGRAPVAVEAPRAALIGVTVAAAQRRPVGEPVRAVATIAPDEARVSHVHTRVAGWIERLYVNTTGQRVRAGQPLVAIFSQELFASQAEFLAARRAAGSLGPALAGAQATLLESARTRLRVLGMTDGEIATLERTGVPIRNVVVPAPRSGVVLHRGIALGTAVDPSTELVTVADLARVWVFAEVPEAAIPSVTVGTPVALSFPAAGVSGLAARVDFLYPTLTEQTRTLRARIAVPNPDGRLRPGTYGTAEIRVAAREALTVPRDAVVDTGETQHVFVLTAPDRYEPRRVVLGARLGERVEVREGLETGERVVASGVFLLDSESRLRAAGAPAGGHGGHGGGGGGGAAHSGHGG